LLQPGLGRAGFEAIQAAESVLLTTAQTAALSLPQPDKPLVDSRDKASILSFSIEK
jgi:hypothetical protein